MIYVTSSNCTHYGKVGHSATSSSFYNLWVLKLITQVKWVSRGPHRYRRTVRVPILRPKIPVKKHIISNQYFGTGTMTEKSAETRDRRENTSQIRDRVIRLSRSIYFDHVIGGDIWDHILSCIFVVKKVTGIGTVRIPEPYKKYRNRTILYNLKGMDPYEWGK